jgi:hypothetical protein
MILRDDAGRWMRWVVPVLLVAAYLLPQPYFERLNNPNENVRVYLTRAIVEHGTFAIDPIVEEWGYVNDKATRDGRLYAGKAPGTSFLAVPGWWVWHKINGALERTPSRREAVLVCRVLGTVLPVLAGLVAFAFWLRSRIRDALVRDIVLVALALGSTMYPYGVLFASHTLVAVFVLGVLLCAERHAEAPDRITPPLLAGFLAGWAICAEYPALFGAALAAVWGLWRSPCRVRYVALVVAGGILPAALLAGYHHVAFGSALHTAYDHLENPDFRASHSEGFYGLARVREQALWGSFFAPSNGLFFFAPWTLLAVVLLPFSVRLRELRGPALITAASLGAYAVFVSMVDNWRGGWTAGPRYIVPVLPFLAWYLALALDALRTHRRAHAVCLVAASLTLVASIACGVSALVFPHYPERLANPIFEVGLRFPGAGLFPENLLTVLGVSRATAFWVTLAAGPVLVLRALLRDGQRPMPLRIASTALVVTSACFLFAVMSLPRTSDPSELVRQVAAVQKVWEPVDGVEWHSLRQGSLPSAVLRGGDAEQTARTARAAAREGWDEAATVLFATAWVQRAYPDASRLRWRRASDVAPPYLPPLPVTDEGDEEWVYDGADDERAVALAAPASHRRGVEPVSRRASNIGLLRIRTPTLRLALRLAFGATAPRP